MRQPRLILLVVAAITIGSASYVTLRQMLIRRSPVVIACGRFHQVTHKGSGIATIYQLSDGRRMLCLKEFLTARVPALEVYLISASDAFENETVENSEIHSLGALESVEGDQCYQLPDDLDLTKYRAVTIWSVKHHVNLTTAPLAPGRTSASGDYHALKTLCPTSAA